MYTITTKIPTGSLTQLWQLSTRKTRYMGFTLSQVPYRQYRLFTIEPYLESSEIRRSCLKTTASVQFSSQVFQTLTKAFHPPLKRVHWG